MKLINLASERVKVEMARVLFTNGIIFKLFKSLFYRLVFFRTQHYKNSGDARTQISFSKRSFSTKPDAPIAVSAQNSSMKFVCFNFLLISVFVLSIVQIVSFSNSIYNEKRKWNNWRVEECKSQCFTFLYAKYSDFFQSNTF